MKKLIILVCLLVLPVSAVGETLLSSPIVRPDIDRFNIDRFDISMVSGPTVTMVMEMRSGSEFVRRDRIAIKNLTIVWNSEVVFKANADDIIEELPPAYQSNPASSIIAEINSGNFGGQASLKEYLELIAKNVLGL